MKDIETILKSEKHVVIDVRTPEEFAGGHVDFSINIPLNEVPAKLEALRKMEDIVLCCASGGRSGQATAFLRQNGVTCINGGSWLTVNHIKKQLNYKQ